MGGKKRRSRNSPLKANGNNHWLISMIKLLPTDELRKVGRGFSREEWAQIKKLRKRRRRKS